MFYNMLCSYEEVMDRNPRVIRTYKQPERGCVYLTKNSKFYGVTTIEYDSCNDEMVRTRGRMDVNAAEEFFNVACCFIRGEIAWVEPVREFICTYRKCNPNICNPDNCPSALGGAAYHQIFSKSCLFNSGNSR
ncbi:MAG: hypothetical protein R8N24_02160 [Alphaproteobacteria bacterium]|nr:hypothetical protein [Alphaproteobacteria bacterium]